MSQENDYEAELRDQLDVEIDTNLASLEYSLKLCRDHQTYVSLETLAFAIHHVLQDDTEALAKHLSARVTPAERARFYGAFTEHRRLFGYTLLHELPDLLRRALHDHDDLEGIEYDLLVVDEYQDLNACELEVLRMLAARGISVVAIGDDDQSIYSFRKAHPEGIRRFIGAFVGARDYALTICHRLATRIAEWAQHVIDGHIGRIKPPIQCPAGAPAGTVALLRFGSEVTEARGVADLVSWLRDTQGVPLSKILILSRTDHNGTFTKPAKEELGQRGIPVFDPSEIKTRFGEADNRKLLATLRLVGDRNDSLAWWSLLKLEPRIGPKFVSYMCETARAEGVTFALALSAAAARGFEGAPAASRKPALHLYQRVNALLDAIHLPVATTEKKWGNWIIEEARARRLPAVSEFLCDLLRKVDQSYTETDDELGRFLSQLQPLAKDMAQTQSDGVRFMTMVGSKGLTVEATIVLWSREQLASPSWRRHQRERRLLYVAMTRSQKYLFLTWAKRRRGPTAHARARKLSRPENVHRPSSKWDH